MKIAKSCSRRVCVANRCSETCWESSGSRFPLSPLCFPHAPEVLSLGWISCVSLRTEDCRIGHYGKRRRNGSRAVRGGHSAETARGKNGANRLHGFRVGVGNRRRRVRSGRRPWMDVTPPRHPGRHRQTHRRVLSARRGRPLFAVVPLSAGLGRPALRRQPDPHPRRAGRRAHGVVESGLSGAVVKPEITPPSAGRRS